MDALLGDPTLKEAIDSNDNVLLNGLLNIYDPSTFARLQLKEKRIFAILLATLSQLAEQQGKTDKINLIKAKIESLSPSATATAPAAGGSKRRKRRTVKRKPSHKK